MKQAIAVRVRRADRFFSVVKFSTRSSKKFVVLWIERRGVGAVASREDFQLSCHELFGNKSPAILRTRASKTTSREKNLPSAHNCREDSDKTAQSMITEIHKFTCTTMACVADSEKFSLC